MSRAQNGEAEVKAANQPNIRLFTVKQQPAYAPSSVVQESWKVCSPQTATEDGRVSAAGYLHKTVALPDPLPAG